MHRGRMRESVRETQGVRASKGGRGNGKKAHRKTWTEGKWLTALPHPTNSTRLDHTLPIHSSACAIHSDPFSASVLPMDQSPTASLTTSLTFVSMLVRTAVTNVNSELLAVTMRNSGSDDDAMATVVRPDVFVSDTSVLPF